MRRVALLGATGSIGRQAIEVVRAHPDLELCAAMSGSTSLAEVAVGVPHTQVGGDARELLEDDLPTAIPEARVDHMGEI